ncbi:MAG: nuclear transport factor 2 family protein [Spirochaetia bacterium]|nr:nuclear transport factor 2 family protein [Spirochaetia bacterium]
MKNRKEIINLWFNMWIEKNDELMDNVFDTNALYIECYGPEYKGLEIIKKWFYEWNKDNAVLKWEIKQILNDNNQSVVEWFFECKMKNDNAPSSFDGLSLIKWTNDNKIKSLKEYSSKHEHYQPYFLTNEEIFIK